MKKQTTVLNVNYPVEPEESRHYNYQLIKNDFLELETDRRITFFSIMANVIENNEIVESVYLCDVSRDEKQARRILDLTALSGDSGKILDELLEEIIG